MARRKPPISDKPGGGERIRTQVKLEPVTPEDAEASAMFIEKLCKRYKISLKDKDAMWSAFACFCTHLLLRNGELPGPGYRELRPQ